MVLRPSFREVKHGHNNVKKYILFAFLTFPFISFSQINDSSRITVKGLFISIGLNSTYYYSDAFFNYLYINGGFANPVYINSAFKVESGDTVPNKLYYNNSSACPIISIGLELSSNISKKIKLNHIIEASYLKFSSQYSGSISYKEGYGFSWTYINDSIQSKYNQTMLSLGYKFQPRYKFIFLSLGINCTINLVKIDQQKDEQLDAWYYDEFNNKTVHAYTKNTPHDTIGSIHFVNFPLQFGIGGYLEIKRVVFKPAFYFTPCLMYGYNLYNISLAVEYGFRKK